MGKYLNDDQADRVIQILKNGFSPRCEKVTVERSGSMQSGFDEFTIDCDGKRHTLLVRKVVGDYPEKYAPFVIESILIRKRGGMDVFDKLKAAGAEPLIWPEVEELYPEHRDIADQ